MPDDLSLESAATPVPPRLQSIAKTVAFWVSFFTIASVLGLAAYRPADFLTWKDQFGSELGAALGVLMLASALVERVVEVFLSIWQRPEVDALAQELEYWQAIQGSRTSEIHALEAQLTNAKSLPSDDVKKMLSEKQARKTTELEAAETRCEAIARSLVPYQAETRRLAMWIGMAVGVMVSGVGVRFLSNLVVVNKEKLGASYSWFVAVDVLVTGAVLAGGSKGVHNLAVLLGAVVDAGQARAGSQKNTRGTPPTPPVGGS